MIGQIVSCFPAVLWGPLFYRQLDKLKTKSLKTQKGDFDALTTLTKNAEKELDWWISELDDSYFPLERTEPEIEMKTDASNAGWGAVCQSNKTGGRWTSEEKNNHINVLELVAIEYGLKSFEEETTGKHVRVLTDNTCAMTYITNMGGSKSDECNIVANRIWQWCKTRNIWLSATHIPGKLNIEADRQSRLFNDRTEWKLNPKIFSKLAEVVGPFDVDMFASRLNYQLKPYVSWGHDPEAAEINALTVNWKKWHTIYVFCPFSIILRVLAKWQKDEAEGTAILPLWTTASWFPLVLRMLTREPILLPRGLRTLQLGHSELPHPLHRKLQLMACTLSANPSKHRAFKDRLYRSSVHHYGKQPRNSMAHTYQGGNCFVLDGVTIPCVHL